MKSMGVAAVVLMLGLGVIEPAQAQSGRSSAQAETMAMFDEAVEMHRQAFMGTLVHVAVLERVVRSLVGGQSEYTGISEGLIANSRAIPLSMTTRSGPLSGVRSFFGDVSIRATSGGRNFEITMRGLPEVMCRRLAEHDLGPNVRAWGSETPKTQTNHPRELPRTLLQT